MFAENFSEKSKNGYYLGVDIGTDSVGYAVTDRDYSLCRFKGEPMTGVALFDKADQCADRRAHRTSRRRYARRQMRVNLIQDLFCVEMAKVDPNFFIQMNESRLWQCDKKPETLVGCEWLDREYNRRFPTVHHLIMELINEENSNTDVRHLYLAVAWLVAHRGHFLSDISCDKIRELYDIKPLYSAFIGWFGENGYSAPWECDADALMAAMSRRCGVRAKEAELKKLIYGGKKPVEDESCPLYQEAIIKLLAGGSIEIKKTLKWEEYKGIEGSICLDDAEKLEAVLAELGDDGEVIRLMSQVYDCAALSKMLSGHTYISEAKIEQYETHKADLRELKRLAKKYCSDDEYKNFFVSETGTYSAYSAYFKCSEKRKGKKITREDFYKGVKKLIAKIKEQIGEGDDTDLVIANGVLSRIDAGTYMPKQVNPENRLIPYQLYYAELDVILSNAEKRFAFLSGRDSDGLSVSDKIRSVFTFRIPYFVGPLEKSPGNKFAWIERKAEGRILPWNFDEMVDLDASEDGFIKRMTNKCTYLPGENVLPKQSLLYCKFTILDEINKINIDGVPISVELKQQIFHELFEKEKKVTKKKLIDFLVSVKAISKGEEVRISGLGAEIKSSYKPYIDFRKLLAAGTLTAEDVDCIIERITCTEDSARLKKWLLKWSKENGKNLSDDDIKYISQRKYDGFGRLSGKLLNGIEAACTETGEVGTVMHFMWNTNDNLMQIIKGQKYRFEDRISEISKEYFSEHPTTLVERLDELGISNAVKRPVMRTLDIIADIVKAKKCPPEKIFVEMTRGEDKRIDSDKLNRGKRLRELYSKLDLEDAVRPRKELDDLGDEADRKLQREALFLYFCQMAKCAYCGKPLDIPTIGTNEYNVDHIWPRAYIKDDSILNNKVLVHSEENGRKTDTYPIESKIRSEMRGFWENLRNAKLINEEKFRRLTREHAFSADERLGFINRQIVETGQSAKVVTNLLTDLYPKTEIVFVKAGNVSEFRHEYGEICNYALFDRTLTDAEKKSKCLVKSRTASDIHHAHDAYLNIVVGNLFHEKFTKRYYLDTLNDYSPKMHILFGRKCVIDGNVIWNPEKHLPTVDRTMANVHIHLTKYQTKQKGLLFDQQPLRAGSSDSLVPLKKNLDTAKYGGYNSPKISFCVLVRYRIRKKYELTIVPVERLVANKYLSEQGYPAKHVREKLPVNAEDISFPLENRIIKVNTVFSLDGFEACVSGTSNRGSTILMRSLMTPRYTAEQIAYIKNLDNISEKRKKNPQYVIDETFSGISREKNVALFADLVNMMNGSVYSKQPGAKLGISADDKKKFEGLTIDMQYECLKNMILYLKTNRSDDCNMNAMGGKSQIGAVRLSANISNWKKNYSDVRIIDRSSSGLFEHRTGNLLNLI